MSESRLNVMPSRMTLTMLNDRIKAAKNGHALLKRKSDAIKMKLQDVLKDILVLKRRVGVQFKDALVSRHLSASRTFCCPPSCMLSLQNISHGTNVSDVKTNSYLLSLTPLITYRHSHFHTLFTTYCTYHTHLAFRLPILMLSTQPVHSTD